MHLDDRANRHAPISPPLRLDNPEHHPWDSEVDVAVVGLGLAGVSAALEAASHGVSVLALDRLAGGGASRLSGGVVYSGGGTRQQQEAGVEDSVDNMYQYLRLQVGDVVSDATVRRFCEQSVANLEWLESHGARYSSRYYKEKNSFPGGAWGLYHSGNEAYAPYNANSTPAARGHTTQGSGYFGGPGLMDPLLKSLRSQARVCVHSHAEVQQLIVDAEQRVIGLRYRRGPQSGPIKALRTLLDQAASKINIGMPRLGEPLRALSRCLQVFDKPQSVRVRKGVVLSAGGFVFNQAMVEQAIGGPRLTAHALGEDCNGSGIRLGLSLGAAAGRLERLTYWRFYAPPHAWLKAISVTQSAERLCNEALYGATVADIMLEKSQGRGWLILDQRWMSEAWAQLRQDRTLAPVQKLMTLMYIYRCTRKAATLEALAHKNDLPAAALRQTIASYNASIAAGEPDACAKPDKYRQPLADQGPYYAIDISIGSKFPCPSLTLGGLRVDELSGQVLNQAQQPITGLYAAGRNALGICGYTYISGLSLADCLFSGRRAGQHIAQT